MDKGIRTMHITLQSTSKKDNEMYIVKLEETSTPPEWLPLYEPDEGLEDHFKFMLQEEMKFKARNKEV